MSFVCLRKLNEGDGVVNAYEWRGSTRINCPCCEAGVAVIILSEVTDRGIGKQGERRVNGKIDWIVAIHGCERVG